MGKNEWSDARDFNGRRMKGASQQQHNVIGKKVVSAEMGLEIGHRDKDNNPYEEKHNEQNFPNLVNRQSDGKFPCQCIFHNTDSICEESFNNKCQEIDHFNKYHAKQMVRWTNVKDYRKSMLDDRCKGKGIAICLVCYKAIDAKANRHDCIMGEEAKKEIEILKPIGRAARANQPLTGFENIVKIFNGIEIHNDGKGDCLFEVMVQIYNRALKSDVDAEMGMQEMRNLTCDLLMQYKDKVVTDTVSLMLWAINAISASTAPEYAKCRELCKSKLRKEQRQGYELFCLTQKQQGTWNEDSDHIVLRVFMYHYKIAQLVIFVPSPEGAKGEYQLQQSLVLESRTVERIWAFNIVCHTYGHFTLLETFNVLNGQKDTSVEFGKTVPHITFPGAKEQVVRKSSRINANIERIESNFSTPPTSTPTISLHSTSKELQTKQSPSSVIVNNQSNSNLIPPTPSPPMNLPTHLPTPSTIPNKSRGSGKRNRVTPKTPLPTPPPPTPTPTPTSNDHQANNTPSPPVPTNTPTPPPPPTKARGNGKRNTIMPKTPTPSPLLNDDQPNSNSNSPTPPSPPTAPTRDKEIVEMNKSNKIRDSYASIVSKQRAVMCDTSPKERVENDVDERPLSAKEKERVKKRTKKSRQGLNRLNEREIVEDPLGSGNPTIDYGSDEPEKSNSVLRQRGQRDNKRRNMFINELAEQLHIIAEIDPHIINDPVMNDKIIEAWKCILFVDKGGDRSYPTNEEFSPPQMAPRNNHHHGPSDHGKMRNLQRLLGAGNIQSAIRVAGNDNGILDPGDPRVLENLMKKHIMNEEQDPVAFLETDEGQRLIRESQEGVIQFDPKEVMAYISRQKRQTAVDIYSLSMDVIKDLIKRHPIALGHLTNVLNMIVANQLPIEVGRWLNLSRGVALNKGNPNNPYDARPICIPSIPHKIIESLIVKRMQPLADEYCGRTQLGCGVKGGTEIMARSVQAHMQQHGDEGYVISLDVMNAFNGTFRNQVLKFIARHKQFKPILAYLLHTLGEESKVYYYTSDYTPIAVKYNVGLNQGGGISGMLYSLLQSDAYLEMASKITADVKHIEFMDDGAILGVTDNLDTGLESLNILAGELEKFGARLSFQKSCFYTHDKNITEDTRIKLQNVGIKIVPYNEGLVICGIQTGPEERQKLYMEEKVTKVLQFVQKVCSASKSTTVHTTVSFQSAWQIVKLCGASQLNHLIRGLPPHITRSASMRFDKQVLNILLDMIDLTAAVPESAVSINHIQQLLYLKSSLGGMGMTSLLNTGLIAYLASIILTAERVIEIVEPTSTYLTVENGREPTYLKKAAEAFRDYKVWIPSQDIIISRTPSLREAIIEGSTKITQRSLAKWVHAKFRRDLNANLPAESSGRDPIERRNIIVLRTSALGTQHNILAGAWVHANPGYFPHRIHNSHWRVMTATRLCIAVVARGTLCAHCEPERGRIMDQFCHHSCFECRGTKDKPRVPPRQTAHAVCKGKLVQGFKSILGSAQVEDNEPSYAEAFQRTKIDATLHRADIKIVSDKLQNRSNTAFIEVTIGDVLAVKHGSGYNYFKGGDATKIIRDNKYQEVLERGYNLSDQSIAKFQIFAFEPYGALNSDAITFIKKLCRLEDKEGTYNKAYNKFLMYVSIGINVARAMQILDSIRKPDISMSIPFRPLPYGQLPSCIGPPTLDHLYSQDSLLDLFDYNPHDF